MVISDDDDDSTRAGFTPRSLNWPAMARASGSDLDLVARGHLLPGQHTPGPVGKATGPGRSRCRCGRPAAQICVSAIARPATQPCRTVVQPATQVGAGGRVKPATQLSGTALRPATQLGGGPMTLPATQLSFRPRCTGSRRPATQLRLNARRPAAQFRVGTVRRPATQLPTVSGLRPATQPGRHSAGSGQRAEHPRAEGRNHQVLPVRADNHGSVLHGARAVGAEPAEVAHITGPGFPVLPDRLVQVGPGGAVAGGVTVQAGLVFHRRAWPLPQEDAEPLFVVEGPAAPGCGGPGRSSGPGAGRRRRPGRRTSLWPGPRQGRQRARRLSSILH